MDLLLESPSSLTVNVRLTLYFSSFMQSIHIVFEHNYLVINVPCFIKSTTRGTITEKPGFNPGEDAAALRKAIEGIGK